MDDQLLCTSTPLVKIEFSLISNTVWWRVTGFVEQVYMKMPDKFLCNY